jgi:phage gp29-like protein
MAPSTFTGLVDSRGRPIEKKALTREVAAVTVSGIRSPITDYPSDGLTPPRLNAILKEADQGQPKRFYELAEQMEEKDHHYAAVLGVRKRSVAQLGIKVIAAGDDARSLAQVEMIEDWLSRDELADELFDMLDAIAKGDSFTEILWDTSERQWRPARLDWRDPRWFRPDRVDLTTPMLIDETGQDVPLQGGKFIHFVARGKSGIPARSGLARLAAWFWLFKGMTVRDWAIYGGMFGIPFRIGKYGPNASEADKDTLFRAVASIAGDAAAIIPASMMIEFVQPPTSTSTDLFEKKANWLDQQMSKATLGQTTTTDAISGGHAVSREHRQVQEDIERADCRALSATINRDLIRTWIDLEFGPQDKYPRIVIGRPEEKDVKLIVETVKSLRLPMKRDEAYELAGIGQPQDGDEVIEPWHEEQAALPALGQPVPPQRALPAPAEADEDEPDDEPEESLNAQDPGAAAAEAASRVLEQLAGDGEAAAADAMDTLFNVIGGIVENSASLEEVRSRLLELMPGTSTRGLALALRQAQVVARLSGRGELSDG